MRDAVMFAVSLFCATATIASEPNKQEVPFQGTWVLESLITNGTETPKQLLKEQRWVFSKDKLEIHTDNQKVEWSYRIDPSTTPKSIDFSYTSTDNKKVRVRLGIYQIERDFLTICYAGGNQGRPEAFKTRDASFDTLIVLRREEQGGRR